MISNEQQHDTTAATADTEVLPQPRRVRYSAEYKRQIVEEVNRAPRGGKTLILRREGLYSTTVDSWRKELTGPQQTPRRGRTAVAATAMKKQLDRLQRENQRLQKKLEQAELIIDVQKKVARMLDAAHPSSGED
jgi:transposase